MPVTEPGDEPEALWSYAVELYGANGVTEACLQLQDEHGIDVPVLLTCFYASELGVVDPTLVPRALDVTATWQHTVVAPLRSVRRALTSPITGFDGEDQQNLRRQVSSVELEAEHRQLSVLQTLVAECATEAPGNPAGAAARSLAHLRAWDLAPDADTVGALAAILCAAVPLLDRSDAEKMIQDSLDS